MADSQERWDCIERLFHAALEKPQPDRVPFLQRECGADETLLHEVESLLRHQRESLLERPAMAHAGLAAAPWGPGTMVGPYRIVGRLGAGGMGEVFRARDTKLGRDVALKTMITSVSEDRVYLERLRQEARVLASVNHANVATLYGIEESGGVFALVMELVEGETLAQRLGRGRLKVSESLSFAVQIAEGLEAAHRKGVIHRDVKPGNVMITSAGKVKVLDFGLAKAAAASGDGGATATLAESRPQTNSGAVIGTASYMSPEQAEGKPVDARSDIFSFGALLYEMVAGHRAFRGDTPISTISAILRDEPPPLAQLAPDTPRDLDKIVVRCLRKDSERRFQSVADLRVALRELKEELESGRLGDATPAGTKKKPKVWLAAAATVIATLVGAAYMRLKPSTPSDVEMRVVPFSTSRGFQGFPAFSPDGNQVAFSWVGDHGNVAQIYVRVIGTDLPLQLTSGSVPGFMPTWAPDGRAIFFLRSTDRGFGIYRVSPLGGNERFIAGFAGFESGLAAGWANMERPFLSITSDGKWLFYSGRESVDQKFSSVYAVSPETGSTHKLNLPPSTFWSAPLPSPNRRQLAIARQRNFNVEVTIADLDGELQIQGEPRLLKTVGGSSLPVAWTPDSQEVFFLSSASVGRPFMRVRADGSAPARVPVVGDGVGAVSVSPKGDRLAYSRFFGGPHLWRVELIDAGKARSPERLIQSAQVERVHPHAWSPDRRKIAIESNRAGSLTVWVANADGSQASILVPGGEQLSGSPAWSPDGKWIAFDSRKDGNPEIYVVSADGGPARRLTNHPAFDVVPSWSSDGSWVYFHSDRTGRFEVFKMPAKGGDAVQITRNGGWGVQESPDGKLLYYGRSRGSVLSVVGQVPTFPLLRCPIGGGEEEEVMDGVSQRSWAVSAGGIWYLWRDKNSATELRFFDFKTRQGATVATWNRPTPAGLALSPDGRTLLFNQLDEPTYEIRLVENFK